MQLRDSDTVGVADQRQARRPGKITNRPGQEHKSGRIARPDDTSANVYLAVCLDLGARSVPAPGCRNGPKAEREVRPRCSSRGRGTTGHRQTVCGSVAVYFGQASSEVPQVREARAPRMVTERPVERLRLRTTGRFGRLEVIAIMDDHVSDRL